MFIKSFEGVVGFDPGINGGLVYMYLSPLISVKSYKVNLEDKDLYRLVGQFKDIPFFVEKIRPRPTNSLRSIIKSVENWGRLKMALSINGIKPVYITPQQWQKRLGLQKTWERPKYMTDEQFSTYKYNERKKWHKDVATKMFKNTTVTHQNADALLIAHYGFKTLMED